MSSHTSKQPWALVLGASSGFGEAIAVELARAGMNIFGVHMDRRDKLPHVAEVRERIRAAGRECEFFNFNAADEDKRKECVEQIRGRLAEGSSGTLPGTLRVLMHSLAWGALKPLGAEPVGKSSPPLSSTLYNNTSSTVVFNSITPNGDFSETNNCGSSLPAGGHCTFAVVFTPTATGTRIGSITVVDNALGHVQTLNLVGTSGGGGGGTGVTASPTKLTFPDQEINTISAPQTVTFTNNGSSSVTITSIRITGNFYAPPGGSNCGVTLGAHQSCYVSLPFNPAAPPGLKSGTLTFNDSAGSLIVQLFGNATDTGLPGLTATVTGVFRYGNSVTVSLQVKNNGTGNADNIQLTSISAVAGGGLVTYTGPLPVILYGLAPGASTSPQLTFNVSGPVQMFQIAERATWQDDFGHGYGGAYAQSVTLSP